MNTVMQKMAKFPGMLTTYAYNEQTGWILLDRLSGQIVLSVQHAVGVSNPTGQVRPWPA